MVFWSSSEAIGCKKYLNLIFKVPATELPDPEADNANPGDSLRQQVDKKIYVASYKVIKTIDQYYPSTPSAITPLKHILLFTSGGKVDRLGSSHNASWADSARILIAKIPH